MGVDVDVDDDVVVVVVVVGLLWFGGGQGGDGDQKWYLYYISLSPQQPFFFFIFFIFFFSSPIRSLGMVWYGKGTRVGTYSNSHAGSRIPETLLRLPYRYLSELLCTLMLYPSPGLTVEYCS